MEATTETPTQASALDLQAETLTGDIRDVLLTHMRSMETPWSKLSEREQDTKLRAVEKCAEDAVRRAVNIVAHHGFPHLSVQTGKWSIDKVIELKVGAASTFENITRLAEHGGGAAILVLVEPGEFFGQRAAAVAEPDQPSMDLDEDEDEDAAASEEEQPQADLSDVTLVSVEGASPEQRAEIEERCRAAGVKVETGESSKPARGRRRAIRETEAA